MTLRNKLKNLCILSFPNFAFTHDNYKYNALP